MQFWDIPVDIYMQNLLKMPNGVGNQITMLFRAKCTQGK